MKGKVGWEEIVDPRLNGKFDMGELDELADVAHRCVVPTARKRPSMRDIVQVLSRIIKFRQCKKHPSTPLKNEVTIDMHQLENRRAEWMDGMTDSFDI